MLRNLGASPDEISLEVIGAIENLPKISGGGIGEAYLSPRAKAVLETAYAEATNMKDEYVSIEHIFLAIAEEKQGTAAGILSRAGVTRDSILKVLLEIRGSLKLFGKKGVRATDLVNPNDGDPVERIMEMTGGGVHHAIECLGLKVTAEQSFQMLAFGGTATTELNSSSALWNSSLASS